MNPVDWNGAPSSRERLSRRTACALLCAALGVTLTPKLGAANTRTLFVIRRSHNRNTVYFDLPASPSDPKQPLQVYWRLFQEDGRLEPLSWLERELAYGYEVKPLAQRDVVQMTFNACKERPIQIVLGASPKAFTRINGVQSVLREIFVIAVEGVVPRVQAVEIVGTAAKTGAPQRERIPV